MHSHAIWKAGVRGQLSPSSGGSKFSKMQVSAGVRLHAPLWGCHLPGSEELIAMVAAVAETLLCHSDGVRIL